MKLLSLFAGIGGFDLAARNAGIETSVAAEIDAQARSVFAKHFPSTELVHDVRDIQKTETDIITAGWPCQGNSVAGKRAGLADPRSGLWGEVRRILENNRPRWFLGENVPGLLSVNRGRDFGVVLQDLAELGYGFAYRVCDAQNFGVPQRRRRVFIVGCLGNWRRAAEVLFESESLRGNPKKGQKASKGTARETGSGLAKCSGTITANKGNIRAEHAWTDQFVASTIPATDGGVSSGMHPIIPHCLNAHGSGRIDGESETFIPMAFSCKDSGNDAGSIAPTLRSMNFDKSHLNGGGQVAVASETIGVRRLTPLECERLQGFPDEWTEYGHDGKRMSDSARYRMIGNSVAVPCVEWIMQRINF